MFVSMLNQILFVINWIAILIFILVFVFYTIKRKKDFFTSATYISIGILFPLILYYFKWSYVIQDKPSNSFLWIFICLFSLNALLQIITKQRLICAQPIAIKRNIGIFIGLANLIWLASILLNNKFCSGLYFPSFEGVDVHAQNAPILVYFVRSTYAVIALDILFYLKYKKIRYVAYAFAQVFLPVLSSGGRMVALEAVVCGISLYLFLHFNGYGKRKLYTEKKQKFKFYEIILLAALGVIIAYSLIEIGIYRAGQFGKYVISYADTIQYTGPLGEVGAWIYGYFVISFNNLNQTILAQAQNPNFIGLYSFPSLYFGILRFNNIFGIKSGAAQFASVYTLREATVPTGLWTFFYDYDVLVFIPMIVAFIKELWLRQKIRNSSKSLIWCVIYFYYIPEWMFMGFTNTIFNDTGLTTGVIIYGLLSIFLRKT